MKGREVQFKHDDVSPHPHHCQKQKTCPSVSRTEHLHGEGKSIRPRREKVNMPEFDVDGFLDDVDTLDDGFDHGSEYDDGFQVFDPDMPSDAAE
jgi:hypothetical protein